MQRLREQGLSFVAAFGRSDVARALAIALIPFVVAIVAVLFDRGDSLIRDHALTELRVRDVGRQPVLIGLYSRDDWSHPGPLLFYMLAVPYRLLGADPSGLFVGALVLNALSVVAMTFLARRYGGTPAALSTLLVTVFVARALGPEVVRDPWVCYVTVLPFGVLCFLVWGMVAGHGWAVLGAIAVGSWLVQTHVGFAPLVATLLAAGAVGLCVHVCRATERDPQIRRAGLAAGVVLVVAWALPLADQFWGSGNLGKTIDWFSRSEEGSHTLADGARIVFGQFAIAPDWLTGTRRIVFFNGETELRTRLLWPLLVVPFAGAAILSWKRRHRAVVQLAAVVTVTIAAAVIAVAHTVGIMYEYRLLWTWMIAAIAAIVVLWTAWILSESRWPNLRPVLVTAVTLVVALVSVVDSLRALDGKVESASASEIATTTDRLAEQFDADGGDVVLRAQSHVSEWYLQGLLLALERQGFDARVPNDPTERFGDHRVAGDDVQAQLLVLANEDLDNFQMTTGLTLLAYAGPLPFAERSAAGRERRDEQSRLLAAFDDGSLTAEEFSRQFEALEPVPGPTIAVLLDERARGLSSKP